MPQVAFRFSRNVHPNDYYPPPDAASLSENDVEPLYSIMNEADIMRYFPNPNPPAVERVQNLVASLLMNWEEHDYGW